MQHCLIWYDFFFRLPQGKEKKGSSFKQLKGWALDASKGLDSPLYMCAYVCVYGNPQRNVYILLFFYILSFLIIIFPLVIKNRYEQSRVQRVFLSRSGKTADKEGRNLERECILCLAGGVVGEGWKGERKSSSRIISDINVVCHYSGSFSFAVSIKYDISFVFDETTLCECPI